MEYLGKLGISNLPLIILVQNYIEDIKGFDEEEDLLVISTSEP